MMIVNMHTLQHFQQPHSKSFSDLYSFFHAAPEVHRDPSSLLVPINTTATFECMIHHCGHGCEVHWIINETSTAHQHQQNHHETQSFAFSSQHNGTTRVYIARVSVRASAVLNNTRMCCLIQDVIHGSRKSAQAVLLVISGNELLVR